MKGYKPFSRKYYTEDVIKKIARNIMQYSSYLGQRIHDNIEGKKHENEAWKYGACTSALFSDDDFEYVLYIRRKPRKEKATQDE